MINVKTDSGETEITISTDTTSELIADACVIFNNLARVVSSALHMSEANAALTIYQFVATTMIDKEGDTDA